MKPIHIFLVALFIIASSTSTTAQNYAGDFGWVGTNTNTSSTTVTACGTQNFIQLSSSPATHTLNGTSARLPITTSDTTSAITIRLRFSQPVCNLRIKVNDLDYGSATTPAAETMTTSPMFASIAPSISPAGPLFNNVGGTLTPPVGVNNTLGWVEFGPTPISSVTLTYNRITGYHAFLDSLTYDCCRNCICDDKHIQLAGTSSIPNSGITSATVSISSSGVPISRLNVSIPYYKSLADTECIKCDPANISMYGKITNLPTIAGVTPTFTGPTASGSAEIVYEFSTPTVIAHSITLNLRFPPTLALKCCPNKVNYCIKLGLIDKDCKICEKLLCLNNISSTGLGVTPKKATSTIIEDNAKARLDGVPSPSAKLLITPNPAMSTLTVTLPNEKEANLDILDLNGKNIQSQKVSSTTVSLNISTLSQGTYILKYTSGSTIINEKFVKK
ncbi:T9SS type A sorting domain-containing protein [Aureispira anguillae]|uniref:T9SS type A sorting domain-containing protein n=1 Tax=Aureispira anguillae TaxID=2864201 RepID=A0A915YD00_9BACT|nr:T9SS type A sorting domain-containing protein [Aureispira anguillae]BDS10771.1 T9SS type A sorting domain-containing protein [Aureispira anguillae]